MTTPTTLADRFAAALDALDDAVGRVDSTAARTAALTYAAAWHEVNGATIKAEVEAEVKAEVDPIAEAARLAYERGSKVRPWSVDEERTWVNAIGNLLDSVAVGPYGSIVACSGGDDLVAKLMAAWSTRAVETAAVDEARRLAVALATVTKERDAAIARGDSLLQHVEAGNITADTLERQRDEARVALEAERKAWQEATFCATPADAKAKVADLAADIRAKLAAIDRDIKPVNIDQPPTRDASDGELSALWSQTGGSVTASNRAVYNLSLAHGRAEATNPAPTPDATKVAGWAVMNGEFIDCVVEAKHKTAADEIAQKNRDRIAACPEPHMAATAKNVHVEPLYLAAPAPTPDASDEEDPTATTASLIAIAKDATAAPVDRWLAAVERWYRVDDYGTEEAVGLLVEAGDALVADENEAGARHVEHLAICQAEIDALRAEVARLTEARATVPAFDLPALEWRDEVDGSRTNVNGVSAFVTPAGPWTLSIFGGANNRIDGVTTVERAVSLLTGRAEAAPVDPDRTGEAAPRAVCPNHGDTVTCTCTTGALHCHACGHTPPLCDECDDDCIIDTGGGR